MMTTIKVEDEMTLETALVSLLPDFEVEVSGKVDGSVLILATMITLVTMITLANIRRALGHYGQYGIVRHSGTRKFQNPQFS